MSKKSFRLIAGILLCLSSLVGCTDTNKGDVISDEDIPDITHVHTYEQNWTYDAQHHWHNATCGHDVRSDYGDHSFVTTEVPATYSKDGKITYTCSTCGYSYSQKLDKLVHAYEDTFSFNETAHWYACLDKGYESLQSHYELHNMEITEVVESTYEEKGHLTYRCTECDYSYQIDLDLADHHYSFDYSSDENGHWFACVDEGYEDTVITGFEEHDYEVETIKSTYDKAGKNIYTCKICGYAYTEDIDKLVHHFSGEYSYDGTHHYKQCTDPGYEDLRIEEEEHDFVYTNHEATYERGGYCNETCKICGYSHDGEEGQPLEHFYSEKWSTDGFRHWHQCTDPGYEDLKKDFGLHDFDEEVHEPTFTEYGWTVLTCKDCGVQYIRQGEDYKKHSYSDGWSNSDDGHWHQCIDEGYEELKTETEGHVDGNWIVDTIPTNTQTGLMHRECKICHRALEYETLPTETYQPYQYLSYSWRSELGGYYVGVSYGNVKTVIIPSEYMGYPVLGIYSYGINSSAVQRVIIPNTVTHFEYGAFAYCSNLESIYIPDGTTYISSSLFESCSSLNNVYIPNSVTTINSGAFRHCTSLQSIDLPNSLTQIYSEAFYGCSSLTEIDIPNSVTTLGYSAFAYCSVLSAVSLPQSLTTLEYDMFVDSMIESICIPSSASNISTEFFRGMYNLSEIVVDTNNSSYSSISGCLYNKSGTNLIKVPCGLTGNFIMPEGVTNFGYYAFNQCKKINSISFPSSLNGTDLFAPLEQLYTCESLTSFTVNPGCSQLEVIENSLFYINGNEYYLVAYPHNLSDQCYTIPWECTQIKRGAFRNNQYLKFINFNSRLSSIDSYAFESSKLVSADLANTNLNYMNDYTFSYCNDLENIYLPDAVTYLGSYSFWYCTSLQSINLPNSLVTIGNCAFACCSSLESVSFNENLKNINSEAFNSCTSLTNVSLPQDLEYIGSYSFNECSNLASIVIPEGITDINSCTFQDCSGLHEVSLPSTLINIESYAFSNSGLTSINIPTSVSYIYSCAFRNCQGLTTIVIPNSVIYLGDNCFSSCSNLQSVKLSENLTWIYSYTFAYCTSLTYIVIPESVQSVDSYAFYNCGSPFSVFFTGAGCQIGNSYMTINFYYYSETEMSGYWRYVNGVPTAW